MPEASGKRERRSVVFLPAMLCDDELYRPQIEGLRDLIDPLVLSVTDATMIEAAKTVLRQAPTSFLLVGTSYGANVALEVVMRAPSRVVGLWLMGCNPGPARDPIVARQRNERVKRGGFDTVVDELAATITYEHGPHATEAASCFRRMARRAGATVFLRQNETLLDRSDHRDDLARITCPTLLVWGRGDRFAGVEHGADMGAKIRGARLVVLEGCGHLPTLERPDATVAVAREWLRLVG
jgi:pimeloyl-ACP methyl ester carboxylesterase